MRLSHILRQLFEAAAIILIIGVAIFLGTFRG
jgi:hypothetical protein